MAAKKKSSKPTPDVVAPPEPSLALVPKQTVGDETLDETPSRMITFLNAASRSEIFIHLETIGYSAAIHSEGWKLLEATSDARFLPSPDAKPPTTAEAAALAEVDAWDEDGFRIANASLRARFPEVHKALMDGLSPARGPAALLGVTKFLNRLDTIERTGQPKGAREAIALLATRKIDKAVRANLRAKIKLAQTPSVLARMDEAALARAAEQRKNALIAARAFFEEWSELARTVIKRRDYLIRLGLAQRISRTEPDPITQPLEPQTKPKRKRRKKR